MRIKNSLVVCAAAGSVASLALAGPPNADHVSEHAKVIIHLDLDALNHSKVGGMLLDKVEGESDNFADLRRVFPDFTLRPEGGLHGVTAYASGLSDDGPENMVLLVHGDKHLKDWEERLAQAVAENGGETVDIDGRQTLVVPMDDETGYLTLVQGGDDYTWVFGQSVISLTEGLGVLAGEKPSAQGPTRERIDGMWKRGTIAMVGTGRLDIFDGMDEKASAIFDLADEAWVQLGEDEGSFFARMMVHSDDQNKINQLVTVFNGALAFGNLMAQDNEELAQVMPLVNAFQVQGLKGGLLKLSFTYDADEMIRFIEEHAEDDWGHDPDDRDDDADHDHHHDEGDDGDAADDDDGWGDDDD